MRGKTIMTVLLMLLVSSCLFANFTIEYSSKANLHTEMRLVDYSAGTSIVTSESIKSVNERKGVFGVQITTTQDSSIGIEISATPFTNGASKFGYLLTLVCDSDSTEWDSNAANPYAQISATAASTAVEVVTVTPPVAYYSSGTSFIPITCIAQIRDSDVANVAMANGTYSSTISVSMTAD